MYRSVKQAIPLHRARPIRALLPLVIGAALTAVTGSLTLLTGCGGAKTASTDATRATGGVQMTIRWPVVTRLIPDAAGSIRVDMIQGGSTVSTRLAPRPPAGQTVTVVTFTAIPEGPVTINARALPNADGSGTALASGSVSVAVIAGETVTSPTLVMDSTITELRIGPADSLSLTVGQSKSFTATAYNAAGEMVLTAPGKLTFALSGAVAALSNDTDGDNMATLSGTAVGSAIVRVSESESSKSVTATLTVSARVVRIVDLGAAAGGSSFGNGLSSGADEASIQVAGRESPPRLAEIAVAYEGGNFFNIGTPGVVGVGTIANDVNASGTVVGVANSQDFGRAIPFVFRDANHNHQADAGETTSLDFVGEASTINDAGTIAGTRIDPSTRQRTEAFVYSNGATIDLESLGYPLSRAFSINASGVVAGFATLASGEAHAALWTPQGGGYAAPVDLGTLPGSASSVATAVNAAGVSVGYSLVADPLGSIFLQPRACFARSGGTLQALPLLHPTDRSSEALAINQSGVIVGDITSMTAGLTISVAVAWIPDSSGTYRVVDLNTVHGALWNLLSASDINDQGVITGYGTTPSFLQHGYLLIP